MALVLKALGVMVVAVLAARLAFELLRMMRGVWLQRRSNKRRIDELLSEIRQIQNSHEPTAASSLGWEGTRKFRVDRRIAESADTHSFYLVPQDGRALPPFLPGQYLTFDLKIPGQRKPTIRCYSLSEQPRRDYYRCTIKKIAAPQTQPNAPAGLASSYFSDVVREGDLLDVKGPRGTFHLDSTSPRPIVLVGGGVGITPLLSMLNSVIASRSDRDVVLFFGVRNGTQHLFKQHLESASRKHTNLTVVTCYSQPCETDVLGDDYDVRGRVNVSLIRKFLTSNNYQFYVCGPGTLMREVVTELEDWGVPSSDIHFETFGPSTVRARSHLNGAPANAAPVSVSFARSRQECAWDASHGTLLDFALANGIPIESGCRAGNCGTCLTVVKSGTVDYLEDPELACEPGSCLPCICVPRESLALDA